MAYTRKQIEDQIETSLKTIDTFYQGKFNNYIGKTSDTKENYSELIATELLNKIQFFDKILSIKRESNGKSYLTKSHHDGKFSLNEKSNRHEEKFAKQLFDAKKKFSSLGKIIDFQVPLKDKQSDKAGKIDLISFDKNNSILYLIELKYGKNAETLLRTILEIYTYYKIVDDRKLTNDFKSLLPVNTIIENIEIKPAVMLVSSECKSYKEFDDIKNRPELLKLAKEMNITFMKSVDGKEFEMITASNL